MRRTKSAATRLDAKEITITKLDMPPLAEDYSNIDEILDRYSDNLDVIHSTIIIDTWKMLKEKNLPLLKDDFSNLSELLDEASTVNFTKNELHVLEKRLDLEEQVQSVWEAKYKDFANCIPKVAEYDIRRFRIWVENKMLQTE